MRAISQDFPRKNPTHSMPFPMNMPCLNSITVVGGFLGDVQLDGSNCNSDTRTANETLALAMVRQAIDILLGRDNQLGGKKVPEQMPAVPMNMSGSPNHHDTPAGQALDEAVNEMAQSGGRPRSSVGRAVAAPRPFERGELVFYPTRVELCGVKICGDRACGLIRPILDLLKQAHAWRRAYSGEELAEMIGAEGGPTAIAGTIRNFRNRVKRMLLVEANVQLDPNTDLIVNNRRHGYRFSEKITVVDRPALPVTDVQQGFDDKVFQKRKDPQGAEADVAGNDSRSRWILAELKKHGRLRRCQIIARTGWSDATVRRALAKLRDEGWIVFEGSARSGYWRLV